MGSRPAPAPTTYIPAPVAPTVFQSVVPEEDFARATQYIQDLKTEREAAKAERYAEIGTPKEIGQRMRERDTKTETAYLDSLPGKEIDYTAGLQPSVLNNIENFLQDLRARRLDGAFSGFKPGESATKVDPVPNIRNIESQIVNRRADEANLNRPEGTAQVATPETPAPAPAPAPAPRPVPAPAPAPRPAPKPAPAPAPAKYYGPTEFSFREYGSKPDWYRSREGVPFTAPPGYKWTRDDHTDYSGDRDETVIVFKLKEKT